MNGAPPEDQSGTTADDTVVRVRFPAPTDSRPERLATLRAYLEVTAGSNRGRRFYLTPREYIIGRSPEVDISLPDDSISRQHAKLIHRKEEYVLVDLDSKNGTLLNGTNVHECPLHSGDVITVGNYSLQFLHETIRTLPR